LDFDSDEFAHIRTASHCSAAAATAALPAEHLRDMMPNLWLVVNNINRRWIGQIAGVHHCFSHVSFFANNFH
jgi:hypothetical protein